MNSEFLLLNNEDTGKMSSSELTRYAEKNAALILEKIDDAVIQLHKYKDQQMTKTELDAGEKILNFISLGNLKKEKDFEALRSDLKNVKSGSAEAMFSFLSLLQESVKFTCSNVKLAQEMQNAFSVIMVKEFKDSNGNLRKLDEETQNFANYILGQADSFVSNQKEFEERVDHLQECIRDIEDIISDQDVKIDRAIDEIKKQEEKGKIVNKKLEDGEKKDLEQDRKLKLQIEKDIEHDRVLQEGIKKDIEQDEAIKAGLLKDEEQDKILQEQMAKDSEHDEILGELKKKSIEQNKAIDLEADRTNKLDTRISELLKKNDELEKLLKDLENGAVGFRETNNVMFRHVVALYILGAIGIALAIINFFI